MCYVVSNNREFWREDGGYLFNIIFGLYCVLIFSVICLYIGILMYVIVGCGWYIFIIWFKMWMSDMNSWKLGGLLGLVFGWFMRFLLWNIIGCFEKVVSNWFKV